MDLLHRLLTAEPLLALFLTIALGYLVGKLKAGNFVLGGIAGTYIAPIFALAGGLLLRFLVINSDDRRTIPGEDLFYSRLPKGDEKFLTAWGAVSEKK